MLIVFAIAQIFLIGTLVVIGSSNADDITGTDNQINDTSLSNCGDCDGDCDDCDGDCSGLGSGQGNQYCRGSGSCSQTKTQNTNGNTVCDGSGTCSQKTQQIRSCGSSYSGCSGSSCGS